MANGKGLGIDGIGGEVYKAIIRCKWPRDGKGLACILLRVLNAILNGNIREDLMTSTVVSVPKKGDLRDMNNSRGLYEFDACVCEDCVCSDGSSYQLCSLCLSGSTSCGMPKRVSVQKRNVWVKLEL